MLTATLGGLIKDHRLKKRLSQLEVSLRIGWKDTSRLSKIEQGRVGKPTRETAEKVIKALDLTDQEKGEFLYVGGYLPTDNEIKRVIREIGPKIDSWLYPAYMMDFSWRQVYINKLAVLVFNLPPTWVALANKMKPNVLQFPFLPPDQFPVIVEKGEEEKNLKPLSIAMIAGFKSENLRYQSEKWYKKVVTDLMSFDEFRKMWPTIDRKDYPKKIFDYEFKIIKGVYHGKKRILKFHLVTAKVINDIRFIITFYLPVDNDTKNFCDKLKANLTTQ